MSIGSHMEYRISIYVHSYVHQPWHWIPRVFRVLFPPYLPFIFQDAFHTGRFSPPFFMRRIVRLDALKLLFTLGGSVYSRNQVITSGILLLPGIERILFQCYCCVKKRSKLFIFPLRYPLSSLSREYCKLSALNITVIN